MRAELNLEMNYPSFCPDPDLTIVEIHLQVMWILIDVIKSWASLFTFLYNSLEFFMNSSFFLQIDCLS
jgi:hypothetical protein